ncbi:MAG: hypothetical protein QOH46_2118 [Solirubrobacteraceae bacterium]|jgi:hypothetical protein|nr:hypothetical protein [Solirubrobacteraceae bacterium]
MRSILSRAALAAAIAGALSVGAAQLAAGDDAPGAHGGDLSPAAARGPGGPNSPEERNMRVIAHNDLGGGERGKGGEGFTELRAKDGRRILYMANESGPTCFSVIDVTDARRPTVLKTIDVPGPNTRCNNLDASGNLLVVANQTEKANQAPAGVQVFDISDRANPKQVGYFDAHGQFSRGAHYVWLADGRYMHVSTGMPDFQPRRPGLDDQIYVIVDLKDPAHPTEVGRWWSPGTRASDAEPLPTPNRLDNGCRLHNVEVFPSRPDRAYLGYIDCGVVVLDISDKAHPKVVSRLDDSPPEPGFTHTVMPVHGGRTLVVTHEAVEDFCTDFPKLVTFLDARNPAALRRISFAPLPANVADLCERGGRFGAHNVHENYPDELAFRSDDLIIGSFFNGGVRIYDIRNPARPREVAYEVPPAPAGSTVGSIQFNDAYVDDRGVIFAGDRFSGGLYVMRSGVIDRAVGH